MNIKVVATHNFEREVKPLLKKYNSLKKELQTFQKSLLENHLLGQKIKEDIYKVRLAVKSKGKGKSGGMRIITYNIQREENEVRIYLLSIYDKSDLSNISDKFLTTLTKDINKELETEKKPDSTNDNNNIVEKDKE